MPSVYIVDEQASQHISEIQSNLHASLLTVYVLLNGDDTAQVSHQLMIEGYVLRSDHSLFNIQWYPFWITLQNRTLKIPWVIKTCFLLLWIYPNDALIQCNSAFKTDFMPHHFLTKELILNKNLRLFDSFVCYVMCAQLWKYIMSIVAP